MEDKEILQNLRGEIDAVDQEMIALFKRRMEISKRIADVKKNGDFPVTDTNRELQVIKAAAEAADENADASEISSLMRTLITLSKQRQNRRLLSAEQSAEL